MRKARLAALLAALVLLAGCAAQPAQETPTNSAEPSETPVETPAELMGQDPLAEIPGTYECYNGVGVWGTDVKIEGDFSFSGSFHSYIEDSGEGYDCTEYICGFRGRFSQPVQVDDQTWLMRLEEIELGGTPGDVTYEEVPDSNGTIFRYIYSEPGGLVDADEILIYLPGVSDLPEGLVPWVRWGVDETGVLMDYCLYNINSETGFVKIG